MLTLSLPTGPYWLALPHGVRLRIRPVTTAVLAAAQARAQRDVEIARQSAQPVQPQARHQRCDVLQMAD
jgi:hypothetical protein